MPYKKVLTEGEIRMHDDSSHNMVLSVGDAQKIPTKSVPTRNVKLVVLERVQKSSAPSTFSKVPIVA
jgi:hypothetical protein